MSAYFGFGYLGKKQNKKTWKVKSYIVKSYISPSNGSSNVILLKLGIFFLHFKIS